LKYKYVFLLGRPGCGKSALYRELETRLLESGQTITFERVDDFPKLWAAVERDDALEKEGKERIYFKRFDDGELSLIDDELFNVILKEVNSDVLQIDKPDHMIFIEFARSNYVEAVQIFDRSILDFCFVIYMEVSFDICWARNVARHEATIDQGGDDHLVPRAEMEKRFRYDDQDVFVQFMRDQNIPLVVVNNEADGEDHLKKQVEELSENLF
jgi:adenylate kinase family enzyme